MIGVYSMKNKLIEIIRNEIRNIIFENENRKTDTDKIVNKIEHINKLLQDHINNASIN